MNKDFQLMTEEEILQSLKTNITGLTDNEASERLFSYGFNELPKKKKDGIIKIFFMQFLNAITMIMIAAAVLSFLIHEYTDAIAIIFIIMADAIMGTIQEWRANKSAEALANMIRMKTTVLRRKKRLMLLI